MQPNYNNLDIKKNFDRYTNTSQYIQKSVFDIQQSSNLSDKEKESIIYDKFILDSNATQAYDTILKDLEKIGILEKDRARIARELSLIYSEQAQRRGL